jgi:Lon protease-like protein
MDIPLFPLNLVFFPHQVLPLHIFEPRYREMINHCIDTSTPFGIVLLQDGQEVGDDDVVPNEIGTAARIVGVERIPDGRMNITVVGTKRFRVERLDRSRSYLQAEVKHYPAINGGTRLAQALAQHVRPKVVEYVDAIASASNSSLPLNKLPEDPTNLAFLIGMALRIENDDKQKLLSLPSVPDILVREDFLLRRETALLHHMLHTQESVQALSAGPTGFLFPN